MPNLCIFESNAPFAGLSRIARPQVYRPSRHLPLQRKKPHEVDLFRYGWHSGSRNNVRSTLAQVEKEALTLPAKERAQLADKLWESVAGRQALEVVMSPELERLLDEGLENLDQAKTTDELRQRT